MNNITMSFEIPSDSDGYVTFECPFCKAEFKLLANEIQNDKQECEELFCPYCGLTDKATSFHSREVVEYARKMAENYMIEQLNQTFGKMAKNINKSKNLKMEFKPLKKGTLKELKTQDTTEEIFQCKICEQHEKVIFCVGSSKVFCAYCGVDL